MWPGQSLTDLTSRVVTEIAGILRIEQLDWVVVQGDTSSAFAAYAAVCEPIPVAYLEAGLRTGTRQEPFPQDINRRLISQLADLPFAPTATADWPRFSAHPPGAYGRPLATPPGQQLS